ncbi:MAG: response regulator [Beijerinckiaceae bacterium]
MTYAITAEPKPRSVLIIEDDKDDVFLLTRALRTVSSQLRIPVRVRHLPNGLEAAGAVARGDLLGELFDILIVDLNMPVMDGEKFLRVLRREFKLENVRAVVLTTSEEPPIHDAARKAGADDVFTKPNTQSELVTIVRNILGVD